MQTKGLLALLALVLDPHEQVLVAPAPTHRRDPELVGGGEVEALMLQAEYAPEPPFPGGTLDTTPDIVRKPMQAMLVPFAEEVRKLAPAG